MTNRVKKPPASSFLTAGGFVLFPGWHSPSGRWVFESGATGFPLSKQNIGDEHNAESPKERIGGSGLPAVGMGFGNHFVADYI